MKTELSYFLCSKGVIDNFPNVAHSKPFKSGFYGDDDIYYVALLCFDEVSAFYEKRMLEDEDWWIYNNFWCNECVPGLMDVSAITLAGMRRNGILSEIAEKTMLTSGKNQAMTINELAEKYVCTPIELINKI